ncbi:hypothetical protein [Fictibacillus phosphorivorans]|nr:hypothetical protein [Fictibacillus phosphorivorans]
MINIRKIGDEALFLRDYKELLYDDCIIFVRIPSIHGMVCF